MPIANDELNEFSEAIWDQFLGLGLSPGDPAYTWASDDVPITGCVQITGAWTGAITIGCSDKLANIAAGAMFAMEISELTSDEVHDTMGELANMLGGNIKSILPPPCQLSLPTVIVGGEGVYDLPGSSVLARSTYLCSGESVIVTVYVKKSK